MDHPGLKLQEVRTLGVEAVLGQGYVIKQGHPSAALPQEDKS